MIYNQDLTNSLISLFGVEVLTWSKSKIRNKIEDIVDTRQAIFLHTQSSEDARHYQRIKSIDDMFTEHYTNELSNELK